MIEVCEEYLSYQTIEEKSKETTRGKIKTLQELLGKDKTIDQITYKDLCDLVNNKLPYLSKRFAHVHQMSVSEALEEGKKNPDKTLREKTLKEYLSRLNLVLDHAVRCGYISNNPAAKLKPKSLAKPNEEREPFTDKQLQAIFDMPIFTETPVDERNHKFWLPLIALYTGMRLEEIAQLYVADIKSDDSIYFFNLTRENNEKGKEKSLKTKNASREIPIHSKLIKLGFLEFVQSKSNETRLFSELDTRKRKLSAAYSKFFGRFINKVNKNLSQADKMTKGHVFHSFRHTVKTQFNRYNYTESEKDHFFATMGWSLGDSTGNKYGKFSLKKKAEILEKALKYEGVNLSKLIPPKKVSNS